MKRYKITEEFSNWLSILGSPFTIGLSTPWGVAAEEGVEYMIYTICDCPICGGTGVAKYSRDRVVEFCECDIPLEDYLEMPNNRTFEDLFKELGVIENV